MTPGQFHRGALLHSVMIALAVVALALKVMVPSGFMVADAKAATGLPIFICTGHGPSTSGDHKAPAKSKADAPCAFSGNLTPVSPVDAALVPSSRAFLPVAAARAVADQAPGRGLAAPPPPAIGPPVLI